MEQNKEIFSDYYHGVLNIDALKKIKKNTPITFNYRDYFMFLTKTE